MRSRACVGSAQVCPLVVVGSPQSCSQAVAHAPYSRFIRWEETPALFRFSWSWSLLAALAVQMILLDRWQCDEVRSKTRKTVLFQDRDDALAVLLPREGPSGDSFGGRGATQRLDSRASASELASPAHDSG